MSSFVTPGEGPAAKAKLFHMNESLDMTFVFHMKVLKDRKKNLKKMFLKKNLANHHSLIYYQNI
jgi:hypothetical protein